MSLRRASEWLYRGEGHCLLGHVFHLGYINYLVSKQAIHLVMGPQKEYSITCFSSCLS